MNDTPGILSEAQQYHKIGMISRETMYHKYNILLDIENHMHIIWDWPPLFTHYGKGCAGGVKLDAKQFDKIYHMKSNKICRRNTVLTS